MRQWYDRLQRIGGVLALIMFSVGFFPSAPVAAQTAGSNTIFLRVVSARSEPLAFDGVGVNAGDVVENYQFIINEDNTGNPTQARFPDCSPYLDPPTNSVRNPSYPASCDWNSIREVPGSSPIVTQGDQSILSETSGLALPNGRYLISVLADGYKIGGAYVSIPVANPDIELALHPLPLPTASIRIQVFNDNNPVNGAPDVPIEDGLAGFRAYPADIAGQVSTDVYGNPLCTEYERDSNGQILIDEAGTPTSPIPGTGGECISDATGIIEIPNLGPNRYAVSVIAPDGSDWIQTTTLEGNHDWDTWLQEGATGNDTEFNVAGEPFPFTIFGFVRAQNRLTTPAAGVIRGSVASVKVYVPFVGGLPYNGSVWGGFGGAKIDHMIEKPIIALSALQQGDQAVYIGRGNADGTFQINNVPDGDYMLTYWDEPQSHILDWIQVTVRNGQTVDVGTLHLTGWFTRVEGSVFVDSNANGIRDVGEQGIPGYTVAVKRRENSLMDRGSIVVVTDINGNYAMENLYPLTQWMVLEAYNDRY